MPTKVQNLDRLLEEIETLFDVMETLGLMESRGSFPVEMPEVLVETTVKMSGDCPCAAREKLQLAMRGAETNETMLAAKQRELEADLEASKRAGPEFASLFTGVESELEKVKARRMKNLKDLDAIDSMHSDYFAKYKPGDDVYDRRAHGELLRTYSDRIKKRIADAEATGSPDPQLLEKLRRRGDRISAAQAENSNWMSQNDPNWEKTMERSAAQAKEKGKSKKGSAEEKAADTRIKDKVKEIEAAAGGKTGAVPPTTPKTKGESQPSPPKPEEGSSEPEKSKAKYLAANAKPGETWRSSKGLFGAKNKRTGVVGDGRVGVRYFDNEQAAKQYAKKGKVINKPAVARDQKPGTARNTGKMTAGKKKTGKVGSTDQLRYQKTETEAQRYANLRKKGTRPKRKKLETAVQAEMAALADIEQFLYEKVYAKSGLGKWFNDESATKEPGWDRYNTKGERIGKCGDAAEGEAYAACLSKQKAQKLGKEGISSFVRRKRAAQRKGGMAKKGEGEPGGGAEPIRVSTGIDKIKEAWSKKYKQSIDCENPKGFSQRAHCQGKEKNQE